MEIDIRKATEPEIMEIRFSDIDVIAKGVGWSGIDLREENGDEYSIRITDIDNLILALQKAKELWGDK